MMSCELNPGGELLRRHCAFCLTEISGEAIKKCGKCHKRAYCSRKCQANDWTPNKKNGQGHKNWCGTDYGEEDVDWMVTPVPGKGLGVIALRDMPAAYKIIVEPGVDKTHPGVADLMPHNGSLDEKYNLNTYAFGEDERGSKTVVLCLRASRVNHSCAPNASKFYDKAVKVVILLALQGIKKGEEIFISYFGYEDLRRTMTSEMARHLLRTRWGIICDQDCLCFNQAHLQKIKQGRELDKALIMLGSPQNLAEAISAAEKCVELQKGLNFSWIIVKRTLEDGLVITVKDMRSVGEKELVLDYFKEAHEFDRRNKELSEGNEQGNEDGQLFCMYRIRLIS